jgi:hypothetical protein
MALVIRGKSTCGLCGNIIQEIRGTISFPAFLKSTHPLANYSDAVFHKECFQQSPYRQKIELLYQQWQEIWNSRPKDLKTIEEMDAWSKSAFANFDVTS